MKTDQTLGQNSNKWLGYEVEKSHLQRLSLTPDEYEKAIQKLCKKYKI